MQQKYLLRPVLIGAVFVAHLMSFVADAGAQSAARIASVLRPGMAMSDVIAALGEPQGKVEMETLRETRLVYANQSLRFVEGKLVVESGLQAPAVTAPLGENHGSKSQMIVRHGNAGSQDQTAGKAERSVKLESVLNEVMHTKPDKTINGSARTTPLMPGMPLPSAPGMINSPYNSPYSNGGEVMQREPIPVPDDIGSDEE